MSRAPTIPRPSWPTVLSPQQRTVPADSPVFVHNGSAVGEQYLDFELEIDGGDGTYQVEARGPQGERTPVAPPIGVRIRDAAWRDPR